MTLELVKDVLNFEQAAAEGQGQTMVDREIIVPDIKPDIDRVLSVEGKVNITGKNIEQDRLAVEGMVNFTVLYAAEGEPQPVYSMNQGTNFSHFIDVPGAAPGMKPEIKCDIEHIEVNKLNGRKLNLRCVLGMEARITDSVPVDAVKEVEGIYDIQLLRDTVCIDENVGEQSAQAIVKGSVEIPQDLPPAADIVKCSAYVHKKEETVDDGKVMIAGSVLVPVLYSSSGDEPDVFRLTDDIVFAHSMDMPGVTPDMACRAEYTIDDIYTELKADDEGNNRHIDVEIAVGIKVKVSHRSEAPVVIDAYAPSVRLEPEIRNVTTNVLFGENGSQVIIKEPLSIPEGTPEIEKVYELACKPSVTECRIEDDRVLIEGIAGCDVIYLSSGETRAAYSFSEEIPFKTAVPMTGCRPHMKPEVFLDIDSFNCAVLTKKEVEVKIALDCFVKVFEQMNKNFIIKLDQVEGEVPGHKASITIYVVQPQDTLWMIAKRYYTTVEDIVKINDIEEPEKIVPGMKLIIPKRV